MVYSSVRQAGEGSTAIRPPYFSVNTIAPLKSLGGVAM